MGIGKRLKEAREHAGLTQDELGKRIGITGSSITNYEREVSHPKEPIIYKLMNELNMEPNFLFQDCVNTVGDSSFQTSFDEQEHIKKYRLLDPLGKEAVDGVLDVEHRRYLEDLKRKKEERSTEESEEVGAESVLYYFPMYETPMSAGTGQAAGQGYPENVRLIKEPPHGASYIAPVCGNSMEPTYQDGQLLFIHAAPEIKPGQVGVFLMDGQQWVKELGNGVLISHNREYEPIPFEESIQCQGLVLGVCDDRYFE